MKPNSKLLIDILENLALEVIFLKVYLKSIIDDLSIFKNNHRKINQGSCHLIISINPLP